MVKKTAKKQVKRKKTHKESNIRTDVWKLVMTQEQRRLAILTVAEYRHFLKPLVLIGYWNWEKLSQLTSNERVNTLEKLIHRTTDNPNPKYYWYFQKASSNHPSFRKFPSYLRRAAIQDALGIVSSFVTRWDSWQRGERKHKLDKPPKLTSMCNSYPALYKGQQVKYHSNFAGVELKIWHGTDWVWMENLPVRKHGKSRHTRDGAKLLSGSFIANKRNVHLSMPVEINPHPLPDSDYVCAIDIGINTTATCSIVGSYGTVKARKFINPARDIDRRDQRSSAIATKSKLTRRLTNQVLPKGFCQGLYRKSKISTHTLLKRFQGKLLILPESIMSV